MNGAPGPYRRFRKELFLQSPSSTDVEQSSNICDPTSRYQSFPSAELLNQSATKSNAKRVLPVHNFTREASQVDAIIGQDEFPSSRLQAFRLSVHSERLSRLKTDMSSKICPSLKRCSSESEANQNPNEARVPFLGKPGKPSISVFESVDLESADDFSKPHCGSYPIDDNGVFSSATSSPSLGMDSNSENVAVPMGESKAYNRNSGMFDFPDDSPELTEPDSVSNNAKPNAKSLRTDTKPKSKPPKIMYRRFDASRLMNPIALPSVHPAAQAVSVMGPLPFKSDRNLCQKEFHESFNQVCSDLDREHDAATTNRSPNLVPNTLTISVPAPRSTSVFIEPYQKTTVLSHSASNMQSPSLQPANSSSFIGKSHAGPDSLGGFNYVESRPNTRRAKRNANEKRKQERELLISEVILKLSREEIMGVFDALFKLSYNGAQDWIKANLTDALEKVSNPLRFALKLVEFWIMRSAQRHSPSHERALLWLLNPLSLTVMQMCQQRHATLSEEDSSYMRQKIIAFGPSLPPKVWADLINLLELPVSEEELVDKARELTKLGRLADLHYFVKELSLQSLLSFDELFIPLIRTRHYKWAADLAMGNPVLLHQLVMSVSLSDAKQSLRIILDCSLDLKAYSAIEVAAKLPELEAIMHQGILMEFVELFCGDNWDLQIEIVKSALKLGHHVDFQALCSLFDISLDDLNLDDSSLIPTECELCKEKTINGIDFDQNYLNLPVDYVFEPSDADLEYILLSSSLIGIDVEYRPSFCQFSQADSQKAAVLQLATPSCCVVLDLLFPLEERRVEILRSVFEDPDILKLGFGIESDLHMFATTLMDQSFVRMQSVLDLQKVLSVVTPPESLKCPLSLSQACETILGVQLDKTEQISNWERRPLRESQIVYAALDSYCLIQIVEKIVEDCLIKEATTSSADNPSSEEDDSSILFSMVEAEIII